MTTAIDTEALGPSELAVLADWFAVARDHNAVLGRAAVAGFMASIHAALLAERLRRESAWHAAQRALLADDDLGPDDDWTPSLPEEGGDDGRTAAE